jgi:hypothetical protein
MFLLCFEKWNALFRLRASGRTHRDEMCLEIEGFGVG